MTAQSTASERPGASADAPAEPLTALRQAIRRIERHTPALEDGGGLLPFGIAPLDAVLGGGLSCGALHEIAARREAEMAAATGFALALAGRRKGPVVWIAEDIGHLESGLPYGPGLDEFGVPPEAVTLVTAAKPREVLWAAEEALRCPAVGAVIVELRTAAARDAVASRRLTLAALSRALALLLRAAPDPRPLAAVTRWRIGAASSAPNPLGTGPPAFAVELVRNRYGRIGSWMLEWNCAEQRFDLASAHPQPMVSAPADRPAATARVA